MSEPTGRDGERGPRAALPLKGVRAGENHHARPALTPALSRTLERGKRKAPRWTVAFLRALERTGEARAAALDAGIDHSTAYARRRAHPDFADTWAGSQWVGSQWVGSQWTGSQWVGSQWVGSQWVGSQWMSSLWEEVGAR